MRTRSYRVLVGLQERQGPLDCLAWPCLLTASLILLQVISAPTGAGKTGVLELAMLRLLSKHLTTEQSLQPLQGGHKIVYIGPIKALVQERHNDWQARYGSQLGLRCVQLTGARVLITIDPQQRAELFL